MSERVVLLCPGQGAQAVGMGRAWLERSAEARQVFEEADRILGDELGAPLSRLCFEGPADRLNQTDVSQPAIFVSSVASWRAVLALKGLGANDLTPVCVAGLSLGEYTALHLAGAIGFEDALRVVTLRGRAMQDAAISTPSGMVALIGADEAQAMALCEASRQGEVLVSANFNAPGQVVISGSKGACERAVGKASEMGLRAQPLPVAGAFHSPIMAPAAERLAGALAGVEIRRPRCPVLSNVTGEPHGEEASGIRRLLVEQVCSPVRWEANCRWILSHVQGEWHELAPGKTLAGLMRRIDRAAKVVSHDTPEG
ncbi:MAG: ACP S-malonyltransferase [Phycisphaeraceae bacterium]|nr:ACP S-malonyltransferase [Phycisphaeraceae bacterium]MCW5754740.1 ACP S-malonyltransferase [Phycisphaeraceae bacterium]